MRKLSKYAALMAIGMAATAAMPTSPLWAQDRDDRDDRDRRDDQDDRDDRGKQDDRDSPDDRGNREDSPTEAIIRAEDLPDEVRRTIESEARGTNHFIDKRLQDERTRYIVHFTDTDGKRMRMRLDERGKVVEEPNLAAEQPDANLDEEHAKDEADRSVRYTDIGEEEVPKRVLKAMEQFREGSHDPFFRRQIRDGKTFYSVHYTTAASERMWVRLAENGEVAEGPHINIGRDIGLKIDRDGDRSPRSRPDKETRSDERARRDEKMRRDEKRRRGEETRRDQEMRREELTGGQLPADVRRSVEQNAAQGGGHRYFRERRGDEVTYLIEWDVDGKPHNLRVDDRGEVVEGIPLEAKSPEAEMRREELTGGQLPADVRRSLEQNAAQGGGHRYFREARGDEVTYLVEWDVDGKPHNLRVDEQGKVVAGIPLGAKAPEQEMRREELTGGDLPADVRRSVEQNAGQGGGHRYFRESKGDEVTYLVEWDVDGKPHNLRVDEQGKVVAGVALAPRPQPTPQPAGEQPITPTAEQGEPDAGGVGVQNQVIGGDAMPPAVRQAFDKYTQGAADHIFQRFDLKGRTLYTAHYTTPEGVRNFVALDDRGQAAVEPRESRWQRGGKGTRFEVVGVDALPAEIRKAVDKAAPRGAEHLFVVRTAEGGEKSYLVQFTNPRGRRMEMTVNAQGKVTEEPDAAREQPFRMTDRQRERGGERDERRSERQ